MSSLEENQWTPPRESSLHPTQSCSSLPLWSKSTALSDLTMRYRWSLISLLSSRVWYSHYLSYWVALRDEKIFRRRHSGTQTLWHERFPLYWRLRHGVPSKWGDIQTRSQETFAFQLPSGKWEMKQRKDSQIIYTLYLSTRETQLPQRFTRYAYSEAELHWNAQSNLVGAKVKNNLLFLFLELPLKSHH